MITISNKYPQRPYDIIIQPTQKVEQLGDNHTHDYQFIPELRPDIENIHHAIYLIMKGDKPDHVFKSICKQPYKEKLQTQEAQKAIDKIIKYYNLGYDIYIYFAYDKEFDFAKILADALQERNVRGVSVI